MTSGKIPIAIAEGDGIGPEIMAALLYVLEEAGANLDYHRVEIGEKCYLAGIITGIAPLTWDILQSTAAFLKAPVVTPQGSGYKSLNATLMSGLGLYASICPCASYSPFIETKHPKMNLVIIHETEEDLYTGIEYRQTPEVCEALRIISRPGTEKIIRFAFEYARTNGRKKVSCFTKDSILQLSDGLFHRIFDEIASEYSDIASEHWLVDIGTAKLANNPGIFDVVVLPNLYGDILSALAAELTSSVSLGCIANIGEHTAMFRPLHGPIPKQTNENSADPSGLLLAAVLMLNHLGLHEVAERIHNAWLKTIEEGIHTYDIYNEKISKKRVSTKEFAHAVAKFLGQKPQKIKVVSYKSSEKLKALASRASKTQKRTCVGVDVFLYSKISPDALQQKLSSTAAPLTLKLLTNRGTKIWPKGQPEAFCADQFRARFIYKGQGISPGPIVETLQALLNEGFDIIRTENLYLFDDEPGFSSNEIYY